MALKRGHQIKYFKQCAVKIIRRKNWIVKLRLKLNEVKYQNQILKLQTIKDITQSHKQRWNQEVPNKRENIFFNIIH